MKLYVRCFANTFFNVSSLMFVSAPSTTKVATTVAETIKTTGMPTVQLFHADSWCITGKNCHIGG